MLKLAASCSLALVLVTIAFLAGAHPPAGGPEPPFPRGGPAIPASGAGSLAWETDVEGELAVRLAFHLGAAAPCSLHLFMSTASTGPGLVTAIVIQGDGRAPEWAVRSAGSEWYVSSGGFDQSPGFGTVEYTSNETWQGTLAGDVTILLAARDLVPTQGVSFRFDLACGSELEGLEIAQGRRVVGITEETMRDGAALSPTIGSAAVRRAAMVQMAGPAVQVYASAGEAAIGQLRLGTPSGEVVQGFRPSTASLLDLHGSAGEYRMVLDKAGASDFWIVLVDLQPVEAPPHAR